MTAAIVTSGLTRSFDTGLAVDDLTMDVVAGEVLALLGPNGAGKTTTVRMMNGILTPDAGSCVVVGLDPETHGDELRRRTGVLTENAGLDDRLSARENLEYTGRIRGLRQPTVGRRVVELLERFGMGDKADHLTAGFSTGERKRVALARALLHDPEVLFLDEPTSGLDPAATRDVAAMIGSLAGEHGRTVVLATHFLGEAGKLADRMAVLHRGRLQAFGRPDDLARDLWPGLDAVLDIGGRADADILGLLGDQAGVISAAPTDDGAIVHVADRDALPRLVALLVGRQIPVYAATPRPATLEDVYFEIESRVGVPSQAISTTPSFLGDDR